MKNLADLADLADMCPTMSLTFAYIRIRNSENSKLDPDPE